MKKRGRKSGASLTVISGNDVEVIARPKPPADLTPEQAIEWTAIVDRMPADWFTRESHPQLTQYCRHIVMARHMAQLIDQEELSDEEFDLGRYDILLRMQARETVTLSRLATAMRLTQQAKYTAQAAGTASKNAGQGRKPWDK